ncbi:MAG TPA: tetratricopeptide repeat protein [Thermoanaerobaculia bacterium]
MRPPLILLVALAALAATPLPAQPAGESCSAATWYLAHRDPERALRSLTGMSGGSAENLRGIAKLLAGDANGALEEFDRAIAAEQDAPRLRLNRAVALIRLDRLAEAAAELEALAAKEIPTDLLATVAYHRALVADRAGDLEVAARWLDRALKANPSSADAQLYAGVVLERLGRFQEAGRHYRDYLARDPGSIVAMLRFGIVAHRSGYRDVAARYLTDVVRRAPDSREAIEARKFLILWE